MFKSRLVFLLLPALLVFGLGIAPAGARAPQEPAGRVVAHGVETAPLPQLRVVRTGLIPIIPSATIFVALDKGYFAAEGIDLQWEPVTVTTDAMVQVGAGNLDVALATISAAVLNSIYRGVDIKIIAGNHGNPPSGIGGDPMIVRKDLYDSGAVVDASGLRGRKVGGNALGTFTEYAIDGAMRTAGLTVSDVDFQALPFPDIPNALANRALDAAFVPEPWATQAIERGYAALIVPEFLRGAQITILMAGPTLLRDRALSEAFMRAFLRSLRDLNTEGWTSPANAAIIEKYTRVPAATVQRIIPQYADPEGRINWESLMDQQRFYIERGRTDFREPLDLTRYADDGPRQAALAASR
ncbi:MAG TPA: ABC transporter substrate-binding protein [Chloroflexota bacterium]|nr:ABC transporter substrate-binding protein [Chloroflexota bacterium]